MWKQLRAVARTRIAGILIYRLAKLMNEEEYENNIRMLEKIMMPHLPCWRHHCRTLDSLMNEYKFLIVLFQEFV